MSEDAYYGSGSGARSRRRRAVVTVLLVLLLLFFALWYAMSYIRADQGAGSTSASVPARPACTSSPQQVQVNVYNATNRDGLAARVAAQLKDRGFVVKTVANDPKKRTVTGRGELRYGTGSFADAQLVLRHTGSFQRIKDSRQRRTVDVVVGPDFTRLVAEDKVTTC